MAGRRHTGHNRRMHEAVKEASRVRSSVPLDADPVEVLQEVLDGAVVRLRYAQEKVDELPEDEVFVDTAANGAIPHEWIRLRDKWADDLERLANNLVRNGIARRSVEIQEAQAALMVQSVQAAALEAGISHEQVRALGAALRRQVAESALTREAAADVVEARALPAGGSD